MAEVQHLLTEKVGHTLACTFNRPEAKNACTPNMLSRMLEA